MLISCKSQAFATSLDDKFSTLVKQVEILKNSNTGAALQQLNTYANVLSELSINKQLDFYNLQSELYLELARFQLAKDSATSGLELAKKLSSPAIIIAELSYSRGFAIESLGDFDAATQEYLNGLDVAESLNDQPFIAQGLINLGAIYYITERFERSLIVLNDALTIANGLNDEELKGYIYSELGILYSYLEESDKTLAFYQQSFHHYQNAGKKLYALNVLLNMGIYHLDQKEYDQAIVIFERLMKNKDKVLTDQHYYSAYSGLAWSYIKKDQKDPELAYQYIMIADQYLPGIEQYDALYYSLIDKAYILESLKRYDEALENLYQAEKLVTSEQKQNNHSNYLTIINLKADIYNAQGLYESAYLLKSDYIERVIAIQDNKNIEEIQNVMLKFESEQADLQKEVLEHHQSLQIAALSKAQQAQQSQQWYMGVIALVVVVFAWALIKLIRGQRSLVIATRTDGLTGISNRRRLIQLGEQYFARAHAENSALSILMIDVDALKHINDIHGHKSGDNVLKTIAGIGNDIMRESDAFGRFGGEEFIALLPETTDEQAMVIAQRLSAAVLGYPWKLTNIGAITISVGIAVLDVAKHQRLDTLINDADKLLHQAKNQGRNKVCA